MPITSNDKLLLHIPAPPPEEWLAEVAKRFPQLTVRWEIAKMLPGGIVSPDTLSDEAWEGVTMLALMPPPSVEHMKDVRFVQLLSAGWNAWLSHPKYNDTKLQICSAVGCHSLQIAEWVIGSWLSHSHHFTTYADQMKTRSWIPRLLDCPVTESFGQRIGILGYGSIGRQIARVAHALGMEVYAYTQSPRTTPESHHYRGYCLPNTGDQEGSLPSKWFSGSSKEAINLFLDHDFDLLVLALPLNEHTQGIISREQFDILSKKKTFVTNIARGPVVDASALIDALAAGKIRGAALDVADPEPLPQDHPLWSAPNLFLTPHISWQSTNSVKRVTDLLMENLKRLDQDEPLVNVINQQ